MPRKPTGRPTGRPKGSGELGEHIRLTVRIPQALYDRLETYADGRTFTRGAPQLAICVREALEVYLDIKRQTRATTLPTMGNSEQPLILPTPAGDEIRQPRKIVFPTRNTNWQPESVPESAGDGKRQPVNVPEPAGDGKRQPVKLPTWDSYRQSKSVPEFDSTKYVLGKLCPSGHNWQDTGQSLLSLIGRACKECKNEDTRRRRQAKRQTSP